jgi:hypothetical protein
MVPQIGFEPLTDRSAPGSPSVLIRRLRNASVLAL